MHFEIKKIKKYLMHNEIECRNKMKAYAQTKLIAMKEHTNKANSFYINYAVSINFPTYI